MNIIKFSLNYAIYKNNNEDKRYGINLLVVISLQLNSLVAMLLAMNVQFQKKSHKLCMPFSSCKIHNEGSLYYMFMLTKMGHLG
jgi:hypothetical protein